MVKVEEPLTALTNAAGFHSVPPAALIGLAGDFVGEAARLRRRIHSLCW
jgi:hypothetical protein